MVIWINICSITNFNTWHYSIPYRRLRNLCELSKAKTAHPKIDIDWVSVYFGGQIKGRLTLKYLSAHCHDNCPRVLLRSVGSYRGHCVGNKRFRNTAHESRTERRFRHQDETRDRLVSNRWLDRGPDSPV